MRSIINRMSLSEIYVPYAIPDANWSWRSAFDIGEYNLGEYTESLETNVDVPENAVFFDEVAGDTGSAGGSYEIPHGIAMYERDGGSLWDRLDPTFITRDARYARELVVTWSAAIGNYTYGVEYVFKMNGAIDVNVNATGTTLNQGISSASQGNQYGTVVTPKIAAPGHQHFFDFRIDFDVDGTANRVVEENAGVDGIARWQRVADPGDDARHGGLTRREPGNGAELEDREHDAMNAVGEPTAYELAGSDTGIPYSSPTYPPLLQAPFAQHPLWVTKYKDGELYAGGDYPFQGAAGDGLTAYASPAENVNGQRRRRLVHARDHAHAARRGVPGHDDRVGALPHRAGRLLRLESGAGRAQSVGGSFALTSCCRFRGACHRSVARPHRHHGRLHSAYPKKGQSARQHPGLKVRGARFWETVSERPPSRRAASARSAGCT